MSRRKIEAEERIAIAKKYLRGEMSYQKIAEQYGISETAVKDIVAVYQAEGEEGFTRTQNKKYSKEVRLKAITEYQAGMGSLRSICKKYKISCQSILRRWIKWYNGHKEMKRNNTAKGDIYMTRGRKTTQEERAEIVAFCIEHGKDYGLTVETYKVSYQQIYAWVRKYEEKGVRGLTDRRGKAKPEDEMTEADRLRQENRILQAKIRDQEMEIALLKKLRELRGGDH